MAIHTIELKMGTTQNDATNMMSDVTCCCVVDVDVEIGNNKEPAENEEGSPWGGRGCI